MYLLFTKVFSFYFCFFKKYVQFHKKRFTLHTYWKLNAYKIYLLEARLMKILFFWVYFKDWGRLSTSMEKEFPQNLDCLPARYRNYEYCLIHWEKFVHRLSIHVSKSLSIGIHLMKEHYTNDWHCAKLLTVSLWC